jgi:hypothetical protein
MWSSLAASAFLGACAAALLLLPAAPRAAAQARARPLPAADDAGPPAVALEAALASGDASAALALFAPDAQIKEGVAVLAAGPERVAAWVRGCLLPDVRLVPGTRRLGGATATWAMRDALGCYWRARPDGLRPAQDMAPGEGTLTVAVAQGAIATLTVAYDPAWTRRLLAAEAAPVRTAQARASQTADTAAEATRVAAPATQERQTAPAGPWVATALALLAVIALTLGKTLGHGPPDAP